MYIIQDMENHGPFANQLHKRLEEASSLINRILVTIVNLLLYRFGGFAVNNFLFCQIMSTFLYCPEWAATPYNFSQLVSQGCGDTSCAVNFLI